MSSPTPEILAQHAALTSGNGFALLGNRTQIEFTGADSASFLHNLCTNEVKKLQPGDVREAFITNVQGRTIGHGYIVCRADSLMFDTVPGVGAFLLAHFEKYHIREKVEIFDRTCELVEVLVTGSSVPLRVPCSDIRRIPFLGPDCFFLSALAADVPKIMTELASAGAIECSPATLEIARLESGTPHFGLDITDKNLPQEVGRDKQAISFTKGCYLGQETVARIDALGHVNQKLVGLRFDSETIPSAGQELTAGDKIVGHVTSAAWSPRLAAPFALAYVRREHITAGAKVVSSIGEGQIVSLPVG